MTGDEQRESLAEQAAAWVPPWLRESVGGSAEPAADSTSDLSVREPAAPAEAVAPPAREEPAGAAVVDQPDVAGSAAAEPAAPQPAPVPEPAAAPESAPVPEPAAAPQRPADQASQSEQPAPVPQPAALFDAVGQPEEATADEDARATAYDPPDEPPVGAPPAEARTPSTPGAPLALIDDGELRAALEAILLVVDEPVSEAVLAEVLEQPGTRIAAALRQLAHGYTEEGRGFELRRAAGGWRLYTRPEYAAYVERFVLDGQSVRLTQAALETLAVVAYKQPVTRSRISAIRGVNCDGVVRTLMSRGLIEECGTEPETGGHLYRTTTLFLEKLGLDSVEELPSLAPFLPDDVEEVADAAR